MNPFITVTGPAAPLLRDNVDTDVIIRIERLAGLPREALGPYALEALRLRTDGSEDPGFVLNRPAFRAAPILLAGANFGCGSSREAAVWALLGRGVRCVIAPSFGDIFFGNCFQNGLLPIRLAAGQIEALAHACAQGEPLSIDLEKCAVTTPDGLSTSFEVDPMRREGLLKGLDDIGLTLMQDECIRAWQHGDRQSHAWAWPAPAAGAR